MPAIREEIDAAEARRRQVRVPGHAAPHRGRRAGQREGHRSGARPRLGEFDASGPAPAGAHRRDPPLRMRHRDPGGGRSGGPGFRPRLRLDASTRTAPSRWTAIRSKPAAASSMRAATSSAGRPTSPTPWATARRPRATSTHAADGTAGDGSASAAQFDVLRTSRPRNPSRGRRHVIATNCRRPSAWRTSTKPWSGCRPKRRWRKRRAACAATSATTTTREISHA